MFNALVITSALNIYFGSMVDEFKNFVDEKGMLVVFGEGLRLGGRDFGGGINIQGAHTLSNLLH